MDIPLYGLVKDEKHRTRAIAENHGEIQINGNKKLFAMLTGIQDEVHRFSLSFQQAKHKQRSYKLQLTNVKGIGEAKAKALIKHFKTKAALKEASVEELSAVAKINNEKAYELYNYIKENF